MEFTLKEFNPLDCTEQDWKLYHEFRIKRHQELDPDDPVTPDELVEKARIQEAKDDQIHSERYFIFQKQDYSKIIGILSYGFFTEKNPSYKGNEHILQFDLALLPEFRQKGIGTEVMKYVVEKAGKHGKDTLFASTSEESGKNFLKKLGFSFALAGRENRLYLDEVDWEMVKDWIKQGEERNPEVKLKFFDKIPDEVLGPFAKVYTETMNQQPFGTLDVADLVFTPELIRKREKDLAELGIVPTTALTFEPNGDISGLTEMYYSTSKPEILIQNLTGVKEEYRGRGLGKWLKAALLLKMKERYPKAKIVSTGNADANAPMLSINNRLGFKVYKETVIAQIKVGELKRTLNQFRLTK